MAVIQVHAPVLPLANFAPRAEIMRNLPLTSPPCAPATFGTEPHHPVMSVELVDVGYHIVDFDDHVEVVGVVGEGQGAVARKPAFGGRGEHPANPEGASRVLVC